MTNGHATESVSQQDGAIAEPLQVVADTKSKTVMELQNDDSRPNRPL